MKRIKLIFSIFTALIALSCSESYLDKQPLDTINTENYPRTAKNGHSIPPTAD